MFGNDNLLWQLESHLDVIEEQEKTPVQGKKKIASLIKTSQENTIEGVYAEDLPALTGIANSELDSLM